MRVAIVSGSRTTPPMGLELAEVRLLEAIRSRLRESDLDVRVVGVVPLGRTRGESMHDGFRLGPTLPRRATARANLVHLLGLDLPPPSSKLFVVMVHDLSPLHYDDEGQLPPWIGEIAERASLILTPSRFTADEVQRHLGVPEERIRVVGGAPALDAASASPLPPAELAALGITTPFVLRYGGYTTRKSVPLLLDAWSRVRLGTLVLAGPAQAERDQILATAPLRERIVVLDYVPERLLARLLRTATALVSTSQYEGFGLPPLEALAAGTPVVAVATPFVREICGQAALLVDRQQDALAACLARVLSDDELRATLGFEGRARAKKFSWDRCAGAVLDAYVAAR